jgi:hypothetical protein
MAPPKIACVASNLDFQRNLINIHVYGKLKNQIQAERFVNTNVLKLSPEPGDTIASVLARAKIEDSSVYSIFLNAKLAAARSGMVTWLRYQNVGSDPLQWDLDIPVMAGDRIGVFGRDMAALVV